MVRVLSLERVQETDDRFVHNPEWLAFVTGRVEHRTIPRSTGMKIR
jgi:hypothetical protein